jgi:FkbM family methyltransferase
MSAPAVDYELLVESMYTSLLRRGDVAVDVGAHVGRHTIPMAKRVSPSGRVLAFEPLPQCREALAGSLARLPSHVGSVVAVFPHALSDFRGEADLLVVENALGYSGLRRRDYDFSTDVHTIRVPVTTLDAALDTASLRYLKIDAEGGELDVLRGAVHCLDRFRPLVSFEFGMNSCAPYGVAPLDMARFWHDRGYAVYAITGDSLDADAFALSARAQRIWDYVAVPAEDRELAETIPQLLIAAGAGPVRRPAGGLMRRLAGRLARRRGL